MEEKPLHLLIVEDNPGDERLIKEMLSEVEHESFKIHSASTLEQGLEILEKESVDVAIADLSLPDSSGLSTFQKLAARFPDLPIVILTGFDDRTQAVRAVREGAQDYLNKNQLNPYLLNRAIHYAIERKGVERAMRTSHRLLVIANSCMGVRELLEQYLTEIQSITGCPAIAILANLDQRGKPVVVYEGFPDEFIKEKLPRGITLEKIASAAKKCSSSACEAEKTELSYILYSDCVPAAAEKLEGDEFGEMFRALKELGFQSSSLIPVRAAEGMQGFILLADTCRRAGCGRVFQLLEDAAMQLATALRRAEAEDRLRKTNQELAAANEKLKNAQVSLLQTERLAAVGQLGAGVAHEINNPAAFVYSNLNTMKDYFQKIVSAYDRAKSLLSPEKAAQISEMEREEELEFVIEDTRELINESLEGMRRIRNIVKDLRAFSEADGQGEREIDVNQLLTSALNMLFNQIKMKARVSKDLDNLPPIQGSASRLGQAFFNMIKNAIQAIPPGDSEHNIVRVESRLEGDHIKVIIEDTGEGISPENISRIFDPFFTTRPVGQGMGMGLALAYDAVTQHGGRIEVKSEPGKGTRFEIYLPLGVRESRSASGLADGGAEAGALSGKVLFIDDEPYVLKAYQRVVPSTLEAEFAESGPEAMSILATRGPFDAVVCDLMMPDMDGKELYHKAIERDPSLADRFVFITGGAFTDETTKFERETSCPVLQKPVDRVELLDAIREAVKRKEPEAGSALSPELRSR